MLVKEATPKEHLVTVDEFERMLDLPENSDRLLELINGEIVEKMPTEEQGVIALNIGSPLKLFVKQHKLGRVGVEVRQRLPHEKLNSRMPDISFSTAQRALVRRGGVPEMPDLAVEIKSPSDSVRKLRAKAAYYLENGARLVWLVYPEKRLVEAYRLDGDVELLLEGDTLDGGEVLPGFTLLVADVFADV